MQYWILVIVAIGSFAIHERLSISRYWFLGGMCPLTGVAAAIYQFGFVHTELSAKILMVYVVFFAITILIGRSNSMRADVQN